jgi:signal transduction histidine kinase
VLDLLAPEDVTRFEQITRDVLGGGTGRRTELDLVIGGERRTYDFRIEPSHDGSRVNGVISVGFDITPRKLAENELRAADRRKNEFLATLSHELRNPLTPLRVALDVAKLANPDSAPLSHALEIMDHQITVLIRLVDDLLDLSRITQGKIQLQRERVTVTRIAEAAIEATRPLIEEAHHDLRVQLPPQNCELIGDFTRLTQVFVNLLSNAARFTPPGGHIEFELRCDVPSNLLIARVHDSGVGIAVDLLPRVFEIFVQSRDERGRSQGGLGIGLNLVRRLVELHGGTVAAHSNGPGHGATFVVRLPLPPTSE